MRKTIQVRGSALLFDLDGVLIDSTPAVTRVWQRWAREHGFDADEVVRHAHGRPSIATIRAYLPDADHERMNEEMERREMEDLDGVAPLPGALELVNSIPPHGWTIATSCTRDLAQVRLRAAGFPVPEGLVTASDVRRGKPSAEPYQKAAASLGVPAAECIVFEDAPAGVESGRAAGARVIGLRTTVEEAELRKAGAQWIVNDCRDVRLVPGGDELTLILDED